MSREPKKLALLRILQLLQRLSYEGHPLTQADIARELEQRYGITMERKAVSRNISVLREAGYDIVSVRDGCYLREREFEPGELRALIDGVISSRYINGSQSKALIEKLTDLGGPGFDPHIRHLRTLPYADKADNQELFLNIELVDEAITAQKQLSFDYNRYGVDGQPHKTKRHRVSPYQLLLHNQRYYLAARNERYGSLTFYRLERITCVKILDEPLTPPEQGMDFSALSLERPYLFTDASEKVVFYADESIADQVIDWFGSAAHIRPEKGRLRVTVTTSTEAMRYWALQYLNYVEVISPPKLRENICRDLAAGIEKYKCQGL